MGFRKRMRRRQYNITCLLYTSGQDYLKQLADIKAQIKSLDVVAKISHMEVLAARIFVCASEHPESISRTDKLFKYYFPSVMKLLNVYEDMEKQPIQGENIQKSKREIEESLDTINQALEKLFDEIDVYKRQGQYLL